MSQVSATRKLFVKQMLAAKAFPGTRNKYIYGGVELVRAWIQGIVVEKEPTRFAVDDGTGVVWVEIMNLLKSNPMLRVNLGDYMMIIGPIIGNQSDAVQTPERIQAHQVISMVHKNIHREPLWFLEVIEYWKSIVVNSK